jgi:hypothetical protein
LHASLCYDLPLARGTLGASTQRLYMFSWGCTHGVTLDPLGAWPFSAMTRGHRCTPTHLTEKSPRPRLVLEDRTAQMISHTTLYARCMCINHNTAGAGRQAVACGFRRSIITSINILEQRGVPLVSGLQIAIFKATWCRSSYHCTDIHEPSDATGMVRTTSSYLNWISSLGLRTSAGSLVVTLAHGDCVHDHQNDSRKTATECIQVYHAFDWQCLKNTRASLVQ